MLRILGYLVLLVVVALAGLVGYAAMQPDTFRWERSILVDAPPERIAAIVTDFRRGAEWSPWEKLDPAMARTFTGPETGVGSIYEWDGNSDVGAGRQEIVSVDPDKVTMKLDFKRPFEANNFADFIFTPEGDGTRVTWAIYGPHPLIARVMGIVFDAEGMVGADFERGLASLKQLAEAGS